MSKVSDYRYKKKNYSSTYFAGISTKVLYRAHVETTMKNLIEVRRQSKVIAIIWHESRLRSVISLSSDAGENYLFVSANFRLITRLHIRH